MNPATDPLAQLRDIHLPDSIGLWPLAPGWWILAALLITGCVLLWRFLRARKQALAYRRAACALLQQHWNDFKNDGNTQDYLQNLQVTLRRIALSFDTSSASLTGEQWLAFLDQSTAAKKHEKRDQQGFQSELGQILLTQAYRQSPQVSDEQLRQLHDLTLHWARSHTAIKKPDQTTAEAQHA